MDTEESEIRTLESVSATILGMRFDPRIPEDARGVLWRQSERLDEVIEAMIERVDGGFDGDDE